MAWLVITYLLRRSVLFILPYLLCSIWKKKLWYGFLSLIVLLEEKVQIKCEFLLKIYRSYQQHFVICTELLVWHRSGLLFLATIRKWRYDSGLPRLVYKFSLSSWKGRSLVRSFRIWSFLLCSNKIDKKLIYHLIRLVKQIKTKK